MEAIIKLLESEFDEKYDFRTNEALINIRTP